MMDLMKFKNLSKNDKIKVGLLIMAFAILVIILIANYKRSHKPIQVEEAGKEKTAVIKKTKGIKRKAVRKKKPIEIEAMLQEVGREDPFLPASEKDIPVGPARAELNLVGIMWDEARPLAIINDTIVGEGDMIRNKKVIKIENKSVVLSEDGREYILRLHGFKPRKEDK